MTASRLDPGDVAVAVAVAVIVEAMLGRPMTPDESSRLIAYRRGCTLAGLADKMAA